MRNGRLGGGECDGVSCSGEARATGGKEYFTTLALNHRLHEEDA